MLEPQKDEFEQYRVKPNAGGAAPAPVQDEWEQYRVPSEASQSVLVKDPNTFHGHPISVGGDTIAHLPNLTDFASLGKGMLRGAGHSLAGLGGMITGVEPGPHEAELFRPKNAAEKLGYGGEQVGEFFLPGGLEESAGMKAAEAFPKLARFAQPAARMATNALTSGVVNKAQGGSFKEGAAAGGVFGGLSEAGRAMAPAVAESALGIPKRMRGYGRTPGQAVLDETRGAVRPETIFKRASAKADALTGNLEGMAGAYPGTVSLQPALDVIDRRAGKAVAQNTPGIASQLGGMRDMLSKEFQAGAPIPPDVPASRALDLKRGLRKEYVGNWNPALHAEMPGIAKASSGAIDHELDSALGADFSRTNQRVSSLIPVAERAESLMRDPGLAQNMAQRFKAKTGALAGSIAGGMLGYERGGLLGGAGAATLGLVLPEVLSSPTMQMIAARTIASPYVPRAAKGLALQFRRPPFSGEEGQ